MFPNVSKMEIFGNIFGYFFKMDKKKSIRFPNISILETFGNIFETFCNFFLGHFYKMDKNSDYPISKYFQNGNFWKHFYRFKEFGQK